MHHESECEDGNRTASEATETEPLVTKERGEYFQVLVLIVAERQRDGRVQNAFLPASTQIHVKSKE